MSSFATRSNTSLVFKDKPIFGLDIGFSSLKVMQVGDQRGKKRVVTGYGVASFDATAVTDGVLTKPDVIAKAAYELFTKHLIGKITTHRVALVVPAARTFNRTVTLPRLSRKELDDAVRLEAEQYIPVPIDNLYIDYEIIHQTAENVELLVVAVPRTIVDSYLSLAELLGLEVVAIETTIGATSRLFQQSPASDVPTILIDFGSISTDITILDKTLVVTGTAPGGGDSFTNLIADSLGVTPKEAHVIKTKYGLGVSKKQQEISDSVSPLLQSLLKEVRRMIRYYEERDQSERKIGQVITCGGGTNMPGLIEWMTDHLRLPVRMCDPNERLLFNDLQPPNSIEKPMYATAAGLALMDPKQALT